LIQIKCLVEQSDFLSLRDDWEQLADRCSDLSVFQTYVWQLTWWKHYGSGSPYLLLAYRDSELVAILPLYRTAERVPLTRPMKRIRLIGVGGNTSADYLGQIANSEHANEAATALVSYLFEHKADWDLLELTDLPETSPLLERLQLRHNVAGCRVTLSLPTRISWANLPTSWEQYLEGLSSNARYLVRSTRRKFLALPESRLFQWNDADPLGAVFQELIQLHTHRWQGRSEHFSFSTATYNAFHDELMHEFAKQKWLRLYCMELAGKLIGVFYGYAFRGTLYYFQGGFDPKHEKLKIGHCLMAYAIESAIGEGCDYLDLLRGEHEYKKRWASNIRQTFSWTVTRPTLPSYAHRVFHRVIRPAGMRVNRVLKRITANSN
jgi:CelD/BcsL family acetyltransferase involved in cellulose biosynthesis